MCYFVAWKVRQLYTLLLYLCNVSTDQPSCYKHHTLTFILALSSSFLGTERAFGAEIAFRTELERFISEVMETGVDKAQSYYAYHLYEVTLHLILSILN